MSTRHLIETSSDKLKYYASMNETFKQIFGKNLMLHYPFYRKADETLENRQINLTEHLIEQAGGIDGKTVLEVGCGSGSQSIYMRTNYQPTRVIGIDLIDENIDIAHQQNQKDNPVEFHVDDAQKLTNVKSDSVDFLICVESALHYPSKELFLEQVKRVLKPGGKFVIADIINKKAGRTYPSARWKDKMSYFHWTADEYKSSFHKNGLLLNFEEDLTERVIKGYEGYIKWIKRKSARNFVRYIAFQIFAIIHCEINIGNLKKKENYYLFIGVRS